MGGKWDVRMDELLQFVPEADWPDVIAKRERGLFEAFEEVLSANADLAGNLEAFKAAQQVGFRLWAWHLMVCLYVLHFPR